MPTTLATVRDYLRLIFRRRVVLFTPIIVGSLLIVPLWLVVPPVFEAKARVKRQDLAVVSAGVASGVVSRGSVGGVSMQTLRVEILSYSNLERVIQQLNMDVDLRTPVDWQRKYESLQEHIRIYPTAQGPGVDLIEIAVTDPDAKRAQDIANAVADNYVEESTRHIRMSTQQPVTYYSEKEQQYKDKLRRAEMELQKFTDKRLVEHPAVKIAVNEELRVLGTQARAREIEMAETLSRLTELEKQLEDIPPTVTARTTTSPNFDREKLKNELKLCEDAREQLLQRYTDKHFKVIEIQQRIASLKEDIEKLPERQTGEEEEVINPAYQELIMARLRLKQQIRAGDAALVMIRARIAANQEELKKVVEEGKYYEELVREKGEAEQFYQMNRRALEAARSRLQAEMGDYGTEVTMNERAFLPALPHTKQRVQLALACLGAGLALGIFAMFGLEFCDQSLRGVEDAAGCLGVPILGSMLAIVTPEQSRRMRRRKMVVAGLVGALLVASVVFWLAWDYRYPGRTLGQILKTSFEKAVQ